MENQFLFIETWRGNVLVSASLLLPPTENNERTDSNCSPSQPASLANRRDMHLDTSLPPVPDFWEHKHRGQIEAAVHSAHGSDVLPPSPTTNANARPRPSRRHRRQSHASENTSPVLGYSGTLENPSPVSPCWTHNSLGSNYALSSDWEDNAATRTGSASTATETSPTSSTPSFDQHSSEWQSPRFAGTGFSPFIRPCSPSEHGLPPKRRRLSLGRSPGNYIYDSHG